MLEIIRRSGGTAIPVAEEALQDMLAQCWRSRGDWIGPEGAACLAALPRLVDEGFIGRGDRVVAFNTGSLEKYLPSLRHLL